MYRALNSETRVLGGYRLGPLNNALFVDLTRQIAAKTIGPKIWLIVVAHPDFRSELKQEAKRLYNIEV